MEQPVLLWESLGELVQASGRMITLSVLLFSGPPRPTRGDPLADNGESNFGRIIFWLACLVFVGAHRGLPIRVPEKYNRTLGLILAVRRANPMDGLKNHRLGARGTDF